jgi:hypothetical protein
MEPKQKVDGVFKIQLDQRIGVFAWDIMPLQITIDEVASLVIKDETLERMVQVVKGEQELNNALLFNLPGNVQVAIKGSVGIVTRMTSAKYEEFLAGVGVMPNKEEIYKKLTGQK